MQAMIMSKLQQLEQLIQENNKSIQRLNKLVKIPVYIDSINVVKGNKGKVLKGELR